MDLRSCAQNRLAPLVVAIALTVAPMVAGQELHERGQNIAPVFEGWEQNPDGSFNMVFGYLNRNLDEILNIPIGPNNAIEPGGPDQGQPTHFLTRRHKFVFRVKVPADFGTKDVVWTLTAYGKTERVYGTLKSEYGLSNNEIMMNWGAMPNTAVRGEDAKNQPPTIKLEGASQRTVKVGEPLTLTAFVSDDGFLKERGEASLSEVPGRRAPRYLRAGWFVYRGAQPVTFDPEQRHPEYQRSGSRPPRPLPPPLPHTGKTLSVTATFSEAGTVGLRLMAHDGGLASTHDVTVTVLPRLGMETQR